MTIYEAITQFDARQFNTYSQGDKVQWLSKLDNMVKNHIIDTHEGKDDVAFTEYNEKTDIQNTTLLVPSPYDEMYFRWLEAQVCYYNGEYDKYNNAIIMFNTDYEKYSDYYNRTHTPLTHGKRFLF
jgi:hypothetical protein